ncbi:MAG TPA: NADH-quinone oxidoreductase subunit C [Alphaproteobacteria bacterium]|nr:NADH-quinone oxidoreductase subunit C [Alphaproteobacteria bacterium]HNS44935.1 NADH-quinone oxidoreductase subunit C [Alphaproteobacteria bacterium]
MLDFGRGIQAKLSEAVTDVDLIRGELILNVTRGGLLAVMAFLRDDPECRFAQLIDVCGADYPDRAERFEVVYQLLSIKHNRRVRVKISTDEETPVPSVSALFSSAGWFERETWDLFGVMFDGLADHRRILTDYGFDGHPLRKEFPLTGHVEVRWDEEQRRVVYGPVSLPQDFRVFDNLSPWEALTDVQLPGDEKASHSPKVGWRPVNKSAE